MMMIDMEGTTMAENKLTKKDVMSAWGRWQVYAEMGHSYERMMAVGVASSLGKCLKKIYADDDEKFKRSLQRHMTFFNTEGNWGGAVLGMALAMEEKMADCPEEEKDEAINGLKTSLMGPLAGIGDSIDWGTLKPIICGLGVSMGLTGNILGAVFCVLFCLVILFIGNKCWWLGYSKGIVAMETVFGGPLFKKVVKSASLLGMYMMGVLSASYVALQTVIKIPTESDPLVIQDILDSIIPGLLPVAAVLFVYYILRNKTQKFGLVAVGTVVLCLILSFIGVV